MSLDAVMAQILGVPSDPVVEQEKPVQSTFGWATVTSSTPLRIRRDGETDTLPMTPEVIGGGGFGIGYRVWCQFFGLRVLILSCTAAGGSGGGGGAGIGLQAAGIATGGGMRVAASTGVWWTRRITTMGLGRTDVVPDGFFEVVMPPNGTSIPVYGRSGSCVVSGGILPLLAWDTLYYELPVGGASGSQPGNFRVVNYATTVTVPASWMFVVTRSNDIESDTYRWFDGRGQDYWRPLPFGAGWSNYTAGFEVCWYKREMGEVRTQGLCKGGSGIIANLPAGYRPASTLLFTGLAASTGVADLRMAANGQLTLGGVSTTAGFISLNNIRFTAVT